MIPDLLQRPAHQDSDRDPAGATGVVHDARQAGVGAREGRGLRAKASAPVGGRVATVTLVCFRVGGTAYCVPVALTRSVRRAVGLVPLPEPGRDIVGMVPGDPPLTVIAPFGTVDVGNGGGHVLVIAAEATTFGLLVDEVTRLLVVPVSDLGTAPAGQSRALISGTVLAGDQLLMVADPMTMAEQL